jgi:5'-3' exonuclease
MNIILIDISYYIFYRYYAVHSWWKLAKPDEELTIPYENEEFVEKFKKTFVEKINEIPKKLKIHKEAFKILAGKDCPRNTIWRHNLIKKDSDMKKYKENRIYDDTFMGGPFFKLGLELVEAMKIPILSYEIFEADDCIAISTKYLKQNPEFNIYIIANDMDYLQLHDSNVKIYDLKYKNLAENKKWSGDPKKDLFCKIVMGDKSDNINSIFKKCGIKTALKYYEDEKLFQEKLTQDNSRELYEINKKLIDFNEIPQKLQEKFLSKVQPILEFKS